jgi:hypothetical protein
MSEREQEIRVSLHADKMLRKALDNKNKIMKKLTQKRIKEILVDFCSKCFYNPVFDEGFIETTFGCEDEWEDDNSNRMKKSLIENYLLWYGYDYVLQDDDTAPLQEELINKYLSTYG